MVKDFALKNTSDDFFHKKTHFSQNIQALEWEKKQAKFSFHRQFNSTSLPKKST